MSTLTIRRGALAAGLTFVLLVAAAPAAPASAASWSCDASAVRGALASAPPFEPVTANRGATVCQSTAGGGASALPGLPSPLSAATLDAATDLQPPQATADQQVATATARVSDLRIAPLPGQIPLPPLPPGLASFSIPGGPAVDLTPAIAALLTPPTELLSVQSLTSRVTGQCAGGRPGMTGTSTAGGLRILGRDVGSDTLVQQAVAVTNGQTIAPSQLDLSKVTLPGGAALPAALVGPLQTALAALPPIALPAQVGSLTVRPGEEVRSPGRLTRRALHVTLALGGRRSSTPSSARRPSTPTASRAGEPRRSPPSRRCSARSGASSSSTSCSAAGASASWASPTGG